MANNPTRVLIVDDNVDLAENIAEILQMDGYLTEVAASAEEAFPMVFETNPDVIVTDYRLPGMNGADLVRRFRQTHAHIYAIVISAYTDDLTMGEAKDAGARFMPKPVDFLSLGQFIRGREGSA